MKSILRFFFGFTLLFYVYSVHAQKVLQFSKRQLTEDVAFLKQQIFNVHANPFTEITKEKYEKLFADITTKIKDSLSASELYTLVRPSLAYLSDEHAEIRLPNFFNENKVFLPFNLTKLKDKYLVDSVFLNNKKISHGDEVIAINDIPIASLLKNMAAFTSGFPAQRSEKTMQLFGYLYGLAYLPKEICSITLSNQKRVDIETISIEVWNDYLKRIYGFSGGKDRISYQKYNQIGYIDAASFGVRGDGDFKNYEAKIDSIFTQIKIDKIKQLVINVSENSGGNSAIGDLLISRFYTKPYQSYQVNWKRSDEYLKVFKSYGDEDSNYEKLQPGIILHYESSIITPSTNEKFNGKVYVVIGNGTFSSAMMFATIIKDNKIATLVGQSPKNGHPSHFGEQYSFKLPNTQLAIRFGVKEWIRPAGNSVKNVLIPDIEIDPKNLYEILKLVAEKSK